MNFTRHKHTNGFNVNSNTPIKFPVHTGMCTIIGLGKNRTDICILIGMGNIQVRHSITKHVKF